jgi:hypothetical protein
LSNGVTAQVDHAVVCHRCHSFGAHPVSICRPERLQRSNATEEESKDPDDMSLNHTCTREFSRELSFRTLF